MVLGSISNSFFFFRFSPNAVFLRSRCSVGSSALRLPAEQSYVTCIHHPHISSPLVFKSPPAPHHHGQYFSEHPHTCVLLNPWGLCPGVPLWLETGILSSPRDSQGCSPCCCSGPRSPRRAGGSSLPIGSSPLAVIILLPNLRHPNKVGSRVLML